MISSNAPKSRHYSSSKASKPEYCAASQTNKGHDFACNLIKSMGDSPMKMIEVQTLQVRTSRKRKRTINRKNTTIIQKTETFAKTNKHKKGANSMDQGRCHM